MKTLEFRNGRYYDENGNHWRADIETLESATKKAESLISCWFCSSCSDCSDYKTNPKRFVSQEIGSRNDQTTVYWTNAEDVQIVCGCFRGDLDEFKKAVIETHKDNAIYKAQYLKLIKTIKMLVNQ